MIHPAIRSKWRLLSAMAAACGLTACSGTAVLNALTPGNGYAVERDLAYGGDQRQRLDLYLPEGTSAETPLLVFFYGGNWESGAKADYAFVGQAFASRGYVTAIPDYRTLSASPLSGIRAGRGGGDTLVGRAPARWRHTAGVPGRPFGRRLHCGDADSGSSLAWPERQDRLPSGHGHGRAGRTIRLLAAERCYVGVNLRTGTGRPRYPAHHVCRTRRATNAVDCRQRRSDGPANEQPHSCTPATGGRRGGRTGRVQGDRPCRGRSGAGRAVAVRGAHVE